MNDLSKISASHLRASPSFMFGNLPLRKLSTIGNQRSRESTQRQYGLVSKATSLGWPSQQIVVLDEDLGVSGSGIVERSGFARLTAKVALGHVGIVLGLEVSRLARNNADWYRLLDLCGITSTLIGHADGIYDAASYNDRLLLGLKGTMSEAELHVLRARLLGGIRNKAARGKLRRNLPVGFEWGERDGEVRFHPDEAVRVAIHAVFARFNELGSARRVWLWFRSEGLLFPMRRHYGDQIQWIDPSYIAIYHVLTNPVYAGAYAYGKSRFEVTLDASGARKKHVRKLPQSQWAVFIPDHHEGYIDRATYEANRNGRGLYCMNIGAAHVDEAAARATLTALEPIGVKAAIAAAERLEADYDGALSQWRLAVERANYEAQRAERRCRAVDAENRLVARGLEVEWEKCLRELDIARAELQRREALRPRTLSCSERECLLALGSDLDKVWQAPTTLARDKKELLRTVLEEVIITVDKQQRRAQIALAWRRSHGGYPRLAASAGRGAHRRGHDRTGSSSGRALPRRNHRGHSQSSGAQDRLWPSLHG
ncbi:MAG TPA: recombinase family protein [Acetobacteraceae bacterium]|jgi:DNA invertase Pin-like site-specific DNA recombinase|nr:recombinase family protein [Acetobacteraceae bacterium]